MYRKFSLLLIIAVMGLIAAKILVVNPTEQAEPKHFLQTSQTVTAAPAPTQPTPVNEPQIKLSEPANQKTLKNNYHVFQTFNNCGPASLSMALSYYGINVSQKEIGDDLRPYQNPQGDNDDKSVTLTELAEKAKEFGLVPYHRPNGNIELIKNFITNDIPIITRTWTKPDEDIGHFRVIKGYDNVVKEIIQDDSLQGKNLKYSYTDFSILWQRFNYEYLVLIPKEKVSIAEAILGNDKNESAAWENAVDNLLKELEENPDDISSRLNLSISYYYVGDYEESIKEFEKVQDTLSRRALWYQIEPIQAYFETENYDKVMEISEKMLNNGNRAFSELYTLRGRIYLMKNDLVKAKTEFEKAVLYNKNLEEAQEALRKVSAV